MTEMILFMIFSVSIFILKELGEIKKQLDFDILASDIYAFADSTNTAIFFENNEFAKISSVSGNNVIAIKPAKIIIKDIQNKTLNIAIINKITTQINTSHSQSLLFFAIF